MIAACLLPSPLSPALTTTTVPYRVYARAPAKLNLFLELRGKRPDGYHEIESIMTAVSSYDTLRVDRTDRHAEIRLSTHWHPSPGYWQQALGDASKALLSIPSDQTNLICRAVAKMRATFGIQGGFEMLVRKRTPAGAGMGGASSNAAAALVATAILAGIDPMDKRVASIAAELGSDVPFFLGCASTQYNPSGGEELLEVPKPPKAEAAIATGRGELLAPFALAQPLWFLVVYPPISLSTAAVYQVCTSPQSPVGSEEIFAWLTTCGSNTKDFVSLNRLTDAARKLSPLIDDLLSVLSFCCGSPAMMTGSGSACFCICSERRSATAAADELRRRWAASGTAGHAMVLKSVNPRPQMKACR